MKIKVESPITPHYYAQCHNCSFDAGINTKDTPTMQDVRNAVRKHVRKTGHTVVIEKGVSTTYKPEY